MNPLRLNGVRRPPVVSVPAHRAGITAEAFTTGPRGIEDVQHLVRLTGPAAREQAAQPAK